MELNVILFLELLNLEGVVYILGELRYFILGIDLLVCKFLCLLIVENLPTNRSFFD